MPTYSKNDVILVQYPFSDLSAIKVRPAIVVNAPHPSQDSLIVPLTSKTTSCKMHKISNNPYESGLVYEGVGKVSMLVQK